MKVPASSRPNIPASASLPPVAPVFLAMAESVEVEFERRFQREIRDTEWFKEFVKDHNEEPNLDDPDYDYRRAWKDGARPDIRDEEDGKYHWPSKYKGDNHPRRFINGVDTRED